MSTTDEDSPWNEGLDRYFDEHGVVPEHREVQDHVLLDRILHAIRTAPSPDDLRRVWTRKRRSKKGKPA